MVLFQIPILIPKLINIVWYLLCPSKSLPEGDLTPVPSVLLGGSTVVNLAWYRPEGRFMKVVWSK